MGLPIHRYSKSFSGDVYRSEIDELVFGSTRIEAREELGRPPSRAPRDR